MMAATDKPKRVIDRERQWRKIDSGHYVSPKARFHATRDHDDGWLLLDTEGEFEPEWFARWRDARRRVEAVEFAPEAEQPIELVEDEIRDEFKHVWRVKVVRGDMRLGEIVVRHAGDEVETFIAGPVTVAEAEAFATALMLATHRAAAMQRDHH